jgi:1-deoxy-D-xylulose-5-phosphate reductoisomerase
MKKKILLLGSTGSIGSSTLDAAAAFADRFEIAGLSSHTNGAKLLELQKRFGNSVVTAYSGNSANTTISEPSVNIAGKFTYYGKEGLLEMISLSDADIVVNAIAGAAGLGPSIAALESGKDLVLANKETVVMAGPLIFPLAEKHNCRIIPVDSEHSAIFQLTRFRPEKFIDSIILTASGGPFRTRPVETFSSITIQDALKHPTWNMGNKISIDSATLANKGLEVIETQMFFGTPSDKIQVVVHPQSIVHSLISTTDGCLYAQLSSADMKIPIINALCYPEISDRTIVPFDIVGQTLTFENPDTQKFPMLKFAYQALTAKGAYTIAYNAVNEIAVHEFSKGVISFLQIAELTDRVLQLDWSQNPADFDDVFAIDEAIRRKSRELVKVL